MSRIDTVFEKVKAEGRTALVSFIMAGDPDEGRSLSVLNGLPDAGADIIEVGMPFTDPAADGVTIQKAGQRALAAGMTLTKTLTMVRNFRVSNRETPIILMGYANPLYAYGLAKFVQDAAAAGVDGLIIVDLPPEESDALEKFTDPAGLDIIRLITPTTDEARLKKVLKGAGGFLYYVSITGVTGTASADVEQISEHLDVIGKHTDLPVAIGFGIKTPNDAQEMSKHADAVVVGSAIVEKVKDIQENGAGLDDVFDFVSSLSAALKAD